MFKGLLDSLYKKWELYLFRCFQLAKYIESLKKFKRISAPPIEEILNPKGYEGFVRIPPNPFHIRKGDKDVFYMFFDDFYCNSESDKDISRLFVSIWDRIGIIKRFLGITKETRYCGEPDSEKRLVNEIDIFTKYPESCSPLHSVILGRKPDDPNEKKEWETILKQFQNFLLDREPIKEGEVKSYQNY